VFRVEWRRRGHEYLVRREGDERGTEVGERLRTGSEPSADLQPNRIRVDEPDHFDVIAEPGQHRKVMTLDDETAADDDDAHKT
jgi:hypothetical protein